MIGRYQKAEKFIFDLLHELCPAAQIHPFYNSSSDSFDYRLEFGDHQPPLMLRFNGDWLDDLEEGLKRNRTSLQDEVLKNAIRFTAYINLGKAGRMPRGFLISEILVKERGNWRSNLDVTTVTTDFDDRFTRELVEGLEKLHRFLERHLTENQDLGEALGALRASRDRITGLLQYHRDEKRLNSSGVSTETLSCLKAAVVVQIIEKECRRVKQPLAQIRAAIDQEIYRLVEQLRNSHFLHVPLPEWFSEYRDLMLADSQSGQAGEFKRVEPIEAIHVFLSHKHDDVVLADAIKQCLEKFGIAAFVAHRDIDPSAIWRKIILEHLQSKCNVFAPILTNQFHNSLWTDQETGIAVQAGLPIFPIKVDKDPYGFIDDRQAVPLKSGESLKMCLGLLVGLGTQHPSFGRAGRLCFAKGLESARSYDEAGLIAESLSRLEPFSVEEATAILHAVTRNRQAHQSTSAAKHLIPFCERHREDVGIGLITQCFDLLAGQQTGVPV